MLLFISILIIVGLKMSYFWFIPAIIVWGINLYIKDIKEDQMKKDISILLKRY